MSSRHLEMGTGGSYISSSVRVDYYHWRGCCSLNLPLILRKLPLPRTTGMHHKSLCSESREQVEESLEESDAFIMFFCLICVVFQAKCAQYWPSPERETEIFEEFVVKLNSEDHTPDYTIRHLSLMNVSPNEQTEEELFYFFLLIQIFLALRRCFICVCVTSCRRGRRTQRGK